MGKKSKAEIEAKEIENKIMANLTKEDNIKSPSHYKLEGLAIETIEIVKAVSNQYQGFSANCMGNVIKYLLRAKKKNGLEDLKKAQVYLGWLIEGEEK